MEKKFATRLDKKRQQQNLKLKQKQDLQQQNQLKERVFKRDLLPLIQQINSLTTGLMNYSALLNAITHYFNLNDDRKKEFESCLKWVEDRKNMLEAINKGVGNWEKRIKLCKEWEIDIYSTLLPQQINDSELSDKKKKQLLGIKEDDKKNSS